MKSWRLCWEVRLWRKDSKVWLTKEDHQDKVIQAQVVQEVQGQEDYRKETSEDNLEEWMGHLVAKGNQIEALGGHQGKVDNQDLDHPVDLVGLVDLVDLVDLEE